MTITIKQVKIFHSLLRLETLKDLVINKIKSSGSLKLAKLLTELLNEAEIEELNNKIFNTEIKWKKYLIGGEYEIHQRRNKPL